MGQLVRYVLSWMPSAPMRFPGRASWPKNVGFDLSAEPRLYSSDARPSIPTIGLDSVTCIAAEVFCIVMSDNPVAEQVIR